MTDKTLESTLVKVAYDMKLAGRDDEQISERLTAIRAALQRETAALREGYKEARSRAEYMMRRAEQAEAEVAFLARLVPQGKDGCVTLPDGRCVSPGPCLHTSAVAKARATIDAARQEGRTDGR